MKQTKTGQWAAGTSGNPAGRKPGSGEVAKLRADLAKHLPGIIKVVVERAKGGDMAACRMVLDRVVAPLRQSDEAVPLSLAGETLTDQGRSVVESIAAGELSATQGAALLASLGALAKLVETDELARRVEALEARRMKP